MADTRWFERCFLKWIELIAATHSGFFPLFLLPLYVHDVSSTFIRLKVRSTTVRLLRLWSDINKFCSANDRWPIVMCNPDQGQCTGFNGYNRDLIRSWLLDTRGIRAWSRVNYEKWKWAWILPRLFSRDLRWENKIVKRIMPTTSFFNNSHILWGDIEYAWFLDSPVDIEID